MVDLFEVFTNLAGPISPVGETNEDDHRSAQNKIEKMQEANHAEQEKLAGEVCELLPTRPYQKEHVRVTGCGHTLRVLDSWNYCPKCWKKLKEKG